jgi:hypothetical protein
MWTWLVRLWDYLRRLIMGDDEDDGPIIGGNGNGETENEPLTEEPPPEGIEAVGRELQAFFLELLQGDNLRSYQGAGRTGYLNNRRHGFSPEAWRALSMGDIRAIEAHISAITGSQAVLLYVVCPPF